MGADQFATTATGSTADQAFHTATEQARWEYGNGGYTGTIAEKGSYTIIDTTPRTFDEAVAYADQLLSKSDPRIDDKWGPAGAVPYYAPTTAPTQRTVSFRCRVSADTVDGGNPAETWRARDAVHAAAATYAKKGETVASVTTGEKPIAVKTRVSDAASKGAKRTTYWVRPANGAGGSSQHPTMAAARAALKTQLAAAAQRGINLELEITAVTTRDDGSALASGRVVVEHADWDVEAVLSTSTFGVGAQPTGWVFFGWASS